MTFCSDAPCPWAQGLYKQTMSIERERALEILTLTEKDPLISPYVLVRDVLRAPQDALGNVQKSFLAILVQGTYQYRFRLDYCLDHYSKTPVKKMKPLIRCLMRMGVYQILFLDDVPDSAACNEAVKLAEKRGFSTLKGFVNGVLRTIAREKEKIPWPDAADPGYLRVMYSMPDAVTDHLLFHYGRERTEAICNAFMKPRPVMIRLRGTRMKEDGIDEETLFARMRVAAEGIGIAPHAHVSGVYALTHSGDPARLYGFQEGYFTMQDAASVMAVQSAQIQAGDTVIDLCAAPGGKAAYAFELCGETGQVLARDVKERRMARMERGFARLRCGQIKTQLYDARNTDEALIETADVLLCDVPCSALGIIGRKPEVKYRFSSDEAGALVQLQREIVSASWQYVKKGGVLLYSTCTLNPEENEKQAEWITGHFPFRAEAVKQLFPGEADTDGFFYAVLRRNA